MAVQEKSPLADLRRRHRGQVIVPDDDAYEAARITFNGMLDRRPEVVTRPLDVDDVVAAVSFAVESELPIAVRGGGHGVTGHCVGDGSLVIDLRLMREVAVDAEARTATCGGGALWEDLDPPCQRHGLATPGGTFGDTGVAGLTLGGGIGHLIGLHGLTLDNLLAATVVTPDGAVRRASNDENPELFWALRGGGGNFGVVADFTFQVHPVGRLLGGLLHYRMEDARAAVSVWKEVMADAPDELACFAQVFRSAFDERSGAIVSVAYFGADAREGRDAIRRLTEEVAPVRDTVRPMYYPELQEVFGRAPFGLRNYWSGRFLRELPDELVELVVGTFDGTEVMGGVLLEPLYGAAARVSPEATAFAGREAAYNATFVGMWTDPAEDERWIEWARTFSAGLAPWTTGGGYLNYASEASTDGLETEFGTRRLERLRAVKRQLDPANVFRFNHNILPQ
jgi:FAD/FMN-containing dehydrogenase